DLSANGALRVTNGIVLTGTAGTGRGSVLMPDNSRLYFVGTQSLDNASISLGGTSNYSLIEQIDSGTLSLGTAVTLTQTAPLVEFYIDSVDAVVNAGTIKAAGAANYSRFEIRGQGSVTNRGVIDVTNGDVLDLRGPAFDNAAGAALAVGAGSTARLGSSPNGFGNQGTITLGSGAALDLYGSFSQGDIGALTNSGGSVFINGLLTNSGSVLTTGTGGLGAVVLAGGGTIAGGTVAGGGMLFQNGTLSGVTYEGPLDLSANGALRVTNGIVLTGTAGTGRGSVLMPDNSRLYFVGTQSLDNASISLGGTSNYSLIEQIDSGTLSLGTAVTL